MCCYPTTLFMEFDIPLMEQNKLDVIKSNVVYIFVCYYPPYCYN
jgi:hypothetical protein